jgi:hypothetical protein
MLQPTNGSGNTDAILTADNVAVRVEKPEGVVSAVDDERLIVRPAELL